MSDNSLVTKLYGLREKFEGISEQISDPGVMSDMKRYVSLNKEYRELEPIVNAGDKYKDGGGPGGCQGYHTERKR
jgi:peptide chain release factor 1